LWLWCGCRDLKICCARNYGYRLQFKTMSPMIKFQRTLQWHRNHNYSHIGSNCQYLVTIKFATRPQLQFKTTIKLVTFLWYKKIKESMRDWPCWKCWGGKEGKVLREVEGSWSWSSWLLNMKLWGGGNAILNASDMIHSCKLVTCFCFSCVSL